jgi:ornithine cyclodeaminase/alanine dehydrogenase-like protein (mu-crystallin family)
MRGADWAREELILRPAPEPSADYDDRAVHQALTADPADYLDFMTRHLCAIAHGEIECDTIPRVVFTDPDRTGDFRLMPCVLSGPAGRMKTVKLVGTNLVQRVVPDKITVGKAFCLDSSENFVSASFDACLLSSARTALCAAVAARYLAPQCRRLLIVGAGRVGYYAGLYFSTFKSLSDLAVTDRSRDRLKLFASAAARRLPAQVSCLTSDVANLDADVVLTATTSRVPLIGPDDTRANLVISVGADTTGQHELSSDWIACGDIYCDTLDSLRVGDLEHWISDGKMFAPEVRDLFGLIQLAEASREPPAARRSVFISTGSAIFDNLTIAYILKRPLVPGGPTAAAQT